MLLLLSWVVVCTTQQLRLQGGGWSLELWRQRKDRFWRLHKAAFSNFSTLDSVYENFSVKMSALCKRKAEPNKNFYHFRKTCLHVNWACSPAPVSLHIAAHFRLTQEYKCVIVKMKMTDREVWVHFHHPFQVQSCICFYQMESKKDCWRENNNNQNNDIFFLYEITH